MSVEFVAGAANAQVSSNNGSLSFPTMGPASITAAPHTSVFVIGYFDPDLVLPLLTAVTLRSTGQSYTFLSANSDAGNRNEAWYLHSTPSGSQNIDFGFSAIATFDAGAAVFRNVDLNDPFLVLQASGSAATATAQDATPNTQDLYFDCLSVVQGATIAARTEYFNGTLFSDEDLVFDAAQNFSVTMSRTGHPYSGDGLVGYQLADAKPWHLQAVRVKHYQAGMHPQQFLMGDT